MALDAEQRGVARGMSLAAGVALLALAAGYWLLPLRGVVLTTAGDRLAFALRADILVLAWLAFAIGRVAAGRFFSPADIAGSAFAPASQAIAVRAAFLQNTLEQVVLAVGVHLCVAVLLRGSELVLVPIAVGLFCVGRAAFLWGYARGASHRAFGFALTFYPSVAGCALAILLLIFRG